MGRVWKSSSRMPAPTWWRPLNIISWNRFKRRKAINQLRPHQSLLARRLKRSCQYLIEFHNIPLAYPLRMNIQWTPLRRYWVLSNLKNFKLMTFSTNPKREGAKPGRNVATWCQLSPSFRNRRSSLRITCSIRISGKIWSVLLMRIRGDPNRKKEGRWTTDMQPSGPPWVRRPWPQRPSPFASSSCKVPHSSNLHFKRSYNSSSLSRVSLLTWMCISRQSSPHSPIESTQPGARILIKVARRG